MAKKSLLIMLFFCVLLGSGCGDNFRLPKPDTNADEKDLLLVEIVFTDKSVITGYVNNLGIDPQAEVYVGGSSVNNIYDARGNITGCYNYQHVMYMKILSSSEAENIE